MVVFFTGVDSISNLFVVLIFGGLLYQHGCVGVTIFDF